VRPQPAHAPSRCLAVPKVTAHPSTASVPITVLLYDGLLLCGFNVAIKGLRHFRINSAVLPAEVSMGPKCPSST